MWFLFQGTIVFFVAWVALANHWFDDYTYTGAEAGRAAGVLAFLAALAATFALNGLLLIVRVALRRVRERRPRARIQ